MIEIVEDDVIINGTSVYDIVERYGTPIYIYDEGTIIERILEIRKSLSHDVNTLIFYSMKANSNPHILNIIKGYSLGVDVVSKGELYIALKVGFDRKMIMYTGNNVDIDELAYVVEQGVLLNIDSINHLRTIIERTAIDEIGLRINPGFGFGHHKYAITAGPHAKFGIPLNRVIDAIELCKRYNIKVVRLHSHVGSGISDYMVHLKNLKVLLELAYKVESVNMVDIGGGFAIPYKRGSVRYNFKNLGLGIKNMLKEFIDRTGRDLTVAVEPGRYIVGESGMLVAKVTDVRDLGRRMIVGVNTGMNHLIRPALYNAYHEIKVLTRSGEMVKADIVGNVCESSDILGKARSIAKPSIGDYVVIFNVGAYGYSMASNYNSRPLPAEVLVSRSGSLKLIRKRQSLEDLLRDVVWS